MRGNVLDARITSQTNATIGMLAYGRSEAAKRPGGIITLCASKSTNTGSPACDTNNWEEGWFIMSDLDGDQVLNNFNEDVNDNNILDPGEDLDGDGLLDTANDELLRIGEQLSGDNTMRTLGFLNAGFIQFDSNGVPGSSGTIIICDSRGVTEANAIVMSAIGHTRVARDEESSADNIVNDHRGTNIVCP
ncbi:MULTISPECIES: GspH/FimT family protein [unclassified Oleiphilus]|uniref:GspH/FimT family protein n=1 Tax=unclassified Oleiphilus TaxID=2631174 RepID=UPI0007C3E852|nr:MULTISPECIES: GspH/FimT family protein [unclassified Oleiphilus]KZY50033.1 hypothetical protein A3732_04985 [Oleiphilus sp. HI0050]KZY75355.1 hypothetical protein A3740_02475 [Oleiphilus sp. HI0068]KZY77705.1 hypothetical protein A3741_09240 [Oleiphilus sp. HI0069]KZZ31929.1 hypothetical protein A3755_01555 [Oleiphilus sp. HI0085]KZY56117.1 hypothetical protein A3735_04920 [Oleiphilus sp. HI0061]